MLLSRSVASWVRLGSRLSSGIITTCIPAASAAFTPLGASSNTKHWARTEERKTKWYYPISLLGLQDFTPAYATKLKPKNKQQKNTGKMETGALFPSSCDGLDIPQRSAVYLCQEKYPFNLQLEERCPPHWLSLYFQTVHWWWLDHPIWVTVHIKRLDVIKAILSGK